MSSPSAKIAGGGGESQRLTREQIVQRILRWNDLYGEPPVTADWNPSVARWRAQEWRIPRYQAGDPETGCPWPSLNAVKRRFGGSFDAAVLEAGLTPRRPGPARRAHEARPAVAPRTERPISTAELLAVELEQARRLLRAAEARADEAERVARGWERRSERIADKLDDARARARRAGERARRARASTGARHRHHHHHDSPSVISVPTGETQMTLGEAGVRDAEARARAAEDRERAAVADAERAREAARRALDGEGALSSTELAQLRREAQAAGPAVLGSALKALARARASGDRGALRDALTEVAGAAVRWRDRL